MSLLKDLDKWERHSVADALEPVDFADGDVRTVVLLCRNRLRKYCDSHDNNGFHSQLLAVTVFTSTMLMGEQVILRQGEKGDLFFIIVEGKVVITQTNDKGETGVVGELGPAQYFGLYLVFSTFWLYLCLVPDIICSS